MGWGRHLGSISGHLGASRGNRGAILGHDAQGVMQICLRLGLRIPAVKILPFFVRPFMGE
jgi:hypothetical protein